MTWGNFLKPEYWLLFHEVRGSARSSRLKCRVSPTTLSSNQTVGEGDFIEELWVFYRGRERQTQMCACIITCTCTSECAMWEVSPTQSKLLDLRWVVDLSTWIRAWARCQVSNQQKQSWNSLWIWNDNQRIKYFHVWFPGIRSGNWRETTGRFRFQNQVCFLSLFDHHYGAMHTSAKPVFGYMYRYYRKRGSASYIVRQWLLWEGERERETPVTSLISRWNLEWSCIWLPRRRVDPTRRPVLSLSMSSARTSKGWSACKNKELGAWARRLSSRVEGLMNDDGEVEALRSLVRLPWITQQHFVGMLQARR